MKFDSVLEKIVNTGFVLLLFVTLSYWLPLYCTIPAVFGLISGFLFFFKKTPGMMILQRNFYKTPGFFTLLKALIGLGEKEMFQVKKSRVRTLAGIAISMTCVVGIYFASTLKNFTVSFESHQKNAGWEYYISEERGFTIQLPDNPSVESRELYIKEADKTLSYNEYKSVEASGAYYTVSYMDFPSRWRIVGSNKLLSTAFDLLLKSEPGIELISKESSQHKVYPAISFTLKKDGEEMRGRLILVGNTFYKVMRVCPLATSAEDAQFEDFLRSFQFPSR